METKSDIIKSTIHSQSEQAIKRILKYEHSKRIIDLVLEERQETVYKILNRLSYHDLLTYLNLKYLPMEYKEYILNCHGNTLKKVISSLTLSDITFYYLKPESKLPFSTQKQIFDIHKKSFIPKVNEYTEEEIFKALRYNSQHSLILKLIIDIRINKNNIYQLLNNDMKEELVNYLINTKNDIFIDKTL